MAAPVLDQVTFIVRITTVGRNSAIYITKLAEQIGAKPGDRVKITMERVDDNDSKGGQE